MTMQPLVGEDMPIYAFSHCRDVVAEVTRAGGVGVLGAGAHSPEELATDLKWIRERVGDRPVGVDFLLPSRFDGSEGAGMEKRDLKKRLPPEHIDFVAELLKRYDVPPAERDMLRSGAGIQLGKDKVMALLDTALDHSVAVIASALGTPAPEIVDKCRSAGVALGALAGTAEHAAKHAEAGVDFIVAQGTEAGGHTGSISTMVLVPEVVDAVSPTPVLAAGGIARGRQMAAALALGAAGVWTGSVWLGTRETEVAPEIVEKFLAARSQDTVISRSLTGKPARMLSSAWTKEWEGEVKPLPMPLQFSLTARAMQEIERGAAAHHEGSHDLVTYFVGQVVGSMRQVRTSRQVVEDMVAEFLEAVEDLASVTQA